ncbi:hypothetical protein ACQKP0_15900 [Heyndrickxia sp. NPDC080065]|uniref:hypothetical protein n=1 Tax=Heyndrickxia sp. NPDC080065 TaxID=3390568 RepID=UPI003D0350F1
MAIVNQTEIRLCYDFANYAWENKSQSDKHFGGQPRTKEEFLADQITGKIAELIFKKEVESKLPNIHIELDFMHYLDPLHTDNGDVQVFENDQLLDLKLDIKGSSHKAQWLLVEDYKFWIPNTRQSAAEKYVMIKFDENMPTNPQLRENPEKILGLDEVAGEIKGWELHSSFISPSNNEPWFIYNREERLLNPKLLPANATHINDKTHLGNYVKKVARSNEGITNYIGPRLDANLNYGLPIKWLQSNLNGLFA